MTELFVDTLDSIHDPSMINTTNQHIVPVTSDSNTHTEKYPSLFPHTHNAPTNTVELVVEFPYHTSMAHAKHVINA
jgi:hypothetical protein